MGEVKCKTCTNPQHISLDLCAHKNTETLTNKKKNIIATINIIYQIMCN